MSDTVVQDLIDQPGEKGMNMPRHVAIIMDGNNRWAKQRRLPGPAGHKAGVEAIRGVLRACQNHHIEVLTLFAFSSENWQRPPTEITALMSLFLSYLKRELRELNDNGVRVKIIGERHRFSKKLQQHIVDAEATTASNNKTTLVIAADYGGQQDITSATRKIAEKIDKGELQINEISPEVVDQHMSLSELPKPDLCIRTGGEHRISNFLLWQLAYSELYFTDVYWPDFDEREFTKAIDSFRQRQRRFGRTGDQITEANKSA